MRGRDPRICHREERWPGQAHCCPVENFLDGLHGLDSVGFEGCQTFETATGTQTMRHQNTVYHSLLKALPRWRFDRLVEAHRGHYRDRRLSFWAQFVAMVYAQLSGAQSLRDLVADLGTRGNLFYHLGLQEVRRSTLSDANRDRPAGVFAAAFDLLLPKLTGGEGSEARSLVRLIDATSLPLNETLCAWARFSTGYAAAKLHLVYDPQAACPTYFSITPARVNDVVEAKKMPILPTATYVFDKGYYDFAWWASLIKSGCRFVTRIKENTPVQLIETRPVIDDSIHSDRLIRLTHRMSSHRKNPLQEDTLREIAVILDNGTCVRVLTNDLIAPASEIANLYKTRWQIELFFKWIKQNLRIKKFLGTTENAIKLQIIAALVAFLLIRIAQQAMLAAGVSLHTITNLIRGHLLHRKTIQELLYPPPPKRPPAIPPLLELVHA
jgi:Transposase DDE domain/Domain of unknown function (DUF4372)